MRTPSGPRGSPEGFGEERLPAAGAVVEDVDAVERQLLGQHRLGGGEFVVARH
jgi:hypothetical protein